MKRAKLNVVRIQLVRDHAIKWEHPSGDPTPSSEDRAITNRLKEAGDILGIKVLDHIIVGDGTDSYVSFAESGLM